MWPRPWQLLNKISEWLLLNTTSAMYRLYHGENKLYFNEMMMFACTMQTHLVDFYSASSLRQQSMDRHMLPHSDTLSWFRANQSLLFLLNAACLVEKQQIPIVLLRLGPNNLRHCPQDLRNYISTLLYFQ
jgi:hypothetical protein